MLFQKIRISTSCNHVDRKPEKIPHKTNAITVNVYDLKNRDGVVVSGLGDETRFVACFSRINSVLWHVFQDSGVTGNIQFMHVGIW
jgi:tetraacyldisaccharide-1-P 4'-kinase